MWLVSKESADVRWTVVKGSMVPISTRFLNCLHLQPSELSVPWAVTSVCLVSLPVFLPKSPPSSPFTHFFFNAQLRCPLINNDFLILPIDYRFTAHWLDLVLTFPPNSCMRAWFQVLLEPVSGGAGMWLVASLDSKFEDKTLPGRIST